MNEDLNKNFSSETLEQSIKDIQNLKEQVRILSIKQVNKDDVIPHLIQFSLFK